MQKFNYIEEVRLSSIDAMFELISNELINRTNNFAFRGHTNEAWKLESTIMRYIDDVMELPQNKLKPRDVVSKIASYRLYENFKNNLIINNELPQDKIEKIDLWEYGQHFGLPTPLLDWTRSPFIALFFSLGNSLSSTISNEHSVYVINIDMINHLNEEIVSKIRPKYKENFQPEDLLNEQFPELEIVSKLSEHNRRLSYQQGLFTKLEYYKSVEVWLDRITKELHFDKSDDFVLKKYVFTMTASSRLKILDKLDAMNINYRTLFPDIEGSVKGAIDATTRDFTSPNQKNYSFEASKFD